MTEQKKSLVQDVLGSLLFVAGAFLAFSVSMYLFEGGARQDSNLTTRVVLAVVDTTGAGMGLVFGLLLAALGAVFFFLPRPVSIVRHSGGALAVFLGLTILVGSISTGSAGSLGDLFTNLAGNSTVGALAGVPVGLMIVAIPVWLAWLPQAVRIPAKLGEANPVSAALREGDEGGVTSAEAAALLPVDENEEPVVPAHPIDVRLQGGIPEGALPIEGERSSTSAPNADPEHVRTPSPSPSPTDAAPGGVPAEVGGDGGELAHEDLAPAASSVAPAVVEPPADVDVRPVASAPPELVDPELVDPELVDEVSPVEETGLLRASWETPEDVESSNGGAADEPSEVVAVETLTVEKDDAEASDASDASDPRAADEDEDDEAPGEFTVTGEPEFDWDAEARSEVAEESVDSAADSEEPADEPVVSGTIEAVTPEQDESEEDLEQDERDEGSDEEVEDEAEEEADEEDGEEEDEDGEWEYEEDDGEEVDEDDPEAAYEEWEEDAEDEDAEDEDAEEADAEEEDEEYEDEEYEDEDEEDEDEDGEEEDEEYEDEDGEEEDEEYEDEDGEEEDGEEEDEEYEEEDGEEEDGEYEDEDDEEEDGEGDDDSEEAAEAEPEVVVQPARKRGRSEPAEAPETPAASRGKGSAPRGRGKKAEAPAASESEEDRLHRAGLLLLDAGRVAVSMIQREFDVDFQEATRILDELQARGLIGPYLGGRRRDILLTREQWEAQAPTT